MSKTFYDQFNRPLALSRFYEATAVSGNRTAIPYNATDSINTDTPFDRLTMLSHSRYLYANVGFITGIVDDIAMYSVGTGVGLRSHCKDDAARLAYNKAWEAFEMDCDYSGRIPLLSFFCHALSRSIDIDGDLGALCVVDPSGEPKLQAVKGHRIGGISSKVSKDGVILSKGRVTGYEIQDGDDLSKRTLRPISAAAMSLLKDPKNIDGFRGVPALRHAITRSRDKLDILNNEVIAVKENSSLGLSLTTPDGKDVQGGVFGDVSTEMGPDGKLVTRESLRAGALLRLKQGEKIESYEYDRPSTVFAGFLDYLDEDVATGFNLPLEFIRISRSGLGGPEQRFCMQKAQRKFDLRFLLIAHWLKRVRFFVIGTKINQGELPFVEDWAEVTTHTPAKISVDVGREARENRADIAAGIRTMTEDAAERGLDFDQMRDVLQMEADDLMERAKYLHKKHPEFTLPVALSLLRMLTPNGNLPIDPDDAFKKVEPAPKK